MTAEDMVIDGSTLEQRRDQRAEQLERFIGELSPEDRKGFVGKVNQWTATEGVKVVDASESLFDLESEQKALRDHSEVHPFDDLEPIVKRSTQQRLESLANRLKGSTPAEQEVLLREVGVEYWKVGMPVTQEALRDVAATLLNRTERRK